MILHACFVSLTNFLTVPCVPIPSKVHLETDPTARPIHAQPYSVAKMHEEAFKKELAHLAELCVCKPCGAMEWALSTFIVPKKDGRVQWISDFRELNKVIQRRVYPLPWIQEILTKCSCYKFFFKVNISIAIIYIWDGQQVCWTLYHCNAVWKVYVLTTPNGNQMCSWFCSRYHGRNLP